MPVSDLMRKLISCGAVEMRHGGREPIFTTRFKIYLGMYAGLNRDKITAIQGWRAMLAGFDMSLAMMSDEEITTLVELLEYQLRAAVSAAVSS